jgi:hypothetical protein
VLTFTRPLNAAFAGGTTLTLSGINFGSVASNQVVSIGGIGECTMSSWVSRTSMRCEVPAGTGMTDVANAAAVIAVQSVVGTLVGAFTYDGAPGSVSVATNTNARNHQECGLPPIC